MLTPIVAGFGGVAFLFAALFIVRDRHHAENNIECKYKLQDFYMVFSTTVFFAALNIADGFPMDESSKV